MYNVAIGEFVFIKDDIIEHANDYSPAHRLASKGDVVVIRNQSAVKIVDSDTEFWLVSHPSITNNSFRVNRNEISVYDVLLTHNEKQEYMKKHKMDNLDLRFIE